MEQLARTRTDQQLRNGLDAEATATATPTGQTGRQARTAAEMSKATADWERVGDRFYRKTQLYTSVFDPELELENHVLVGAPLAGAVRRQGSRDNRGATDTAR
jgi:hypothetical protein